MLYKKGDRMACDNYCSISIINSMSKIYDHCLYNRHLRWFTPDREQAGTLPERSCIKHIHSCIPCVVCFMMLFAIASIYTVTKSILGTTVITVIVELQKGSPTPCFLFIVFVNTLIRMLKNMINIWLRCMAPVV